MHLPHHQRDARGMVAFLEIAAHAPLQVHRLAHIKHLAAFIEHTVNARQIGQVFQENIDIEILAHGSGCKKVSDGLNDTAIEKGRLKGEGCDGRPNRQHFCIYFTICLMNEQIVMINERMVITKAV